PIENWNLDANAHAPAGPVLFRGHAPAVAAIPPAVQFAREGDLRVVTAPGCSDGAFRRPDSRFQLHPVRAELVGSADQIFEPAGIRFKRDFLAGGLHARG